MKKFVFYTFLAVGGYLALSHATGFGYDLKAIGSTYSGGVKTLQGR